MPREKLFRPITLIGNFYMKLYQLVAKIELYVQKCFVFGILYTLFMIASFNRWLVFRAILPYSPLSQEIFILLNGSNYFQPEKKTSILSTPSQPCHSPHFKQKKKLRLSSPRSTPLKRKEKQTFTSPSSPVPHLSRSLSSPTLKNKVAQNLKKISSHNPPTYIDENLPQNSDTTTAQELALKTISLTTLEHQLTTMKQHLQEIQEDYQRNTQHLKSVLSHKDKIIGVYEMALKRRNSGATSPFVEFDISDMTWEEHRTQLEAIRSVSLWLQSELDRVEKENSIRISSRDYEIQRLCQQIEYYQEIVKNQLPIRTVPADVVDNLIAENNDLRAKYFFSLAVSAKLQKTKEGNLCNVNVADLYEKTKQECVHFQDWPLWLDYEIQNRAYLF